ncbi:TonB-dependent receptor [Bowmanella sp. Y26]|uniref:TonB-dependent receptor n=1 Tax=Bowmanella yangjiangensis TaxID=2811230 RepID=UPI001BDD1670|nr:TonB-dependent receptor [Bowmanella yangjiangensis]MBT1063686.1 TonB-dependent receptor [Bowmanella yangjiangensis]
MTSTKLNKITQGLKLALVVGATISSQQLIAQEATAGADENLEVIQVKGLKASSVASINAKRFAGSQLDGISATDIGKLPDVTISDSLQRISGVQIERVAGEGGPVQIRGLPQIDTTFNGEVFLSATTIDSSGADFSDLPSQLFSGVDVYKSSESKLSGAGISGSINLKSRRPFDMEEGYTFNVGAEASRGSITKETDPLLNGLVAYNNGKFGVLFSAVKSDSNLATDYNGYFDTSENGGIGATNNNYTWGANGSGESRRHVVPQGFSAFNKTEQRKRTAFQLSAQADLGEGFELTFDAFYTDQDRFNNRSGFSHNNRWYTFNDYAYATSDGWTGDTFTDADGNTWEGVNKYDLKSWRMQSFTQVNNNYETSENYSLDLKYDHGGALTGNFRMTQAKATASMRHGYGEGDIMSIDKGSLVTGPGQFAPAEYCVNGEDIVGSAGGCYAYFSPGGIQDSFILTVDQSGEHPNFSGFDQMVNGGQGVMSVADYMKSIDSYHIGAFSSEGNTDKEGEIDTYSTKWNYKLENDFITSIDVGARFMQRSVDVDTFDYMSTYGGGCDIAQWKAVDQYYSTTGNFDCTGVQGTGEYLTAEGVGLDGTVHGQAGDWVPYTLLPPTRLDHHTTVSWQTNFGNVGGIPGVWVIDPSNFKDPKAYHERVFGNVVRVEKPGDSYDVELEEVSYFVQGNFAFGDFTGNLGMKVVETDLFVRQNVTGPSLPHSGTAADEGDEVYERSYTDYLPSFNLAYAATDDVILRAAWAKNMQALNLSAWGGGKTVGKTIDGSCDCLRVRNGTLTGNPSLNPWRSENLSFSAEWYAGSASMAYASLFKIDIESFTQGGTVMIDEPDDDGVRRGPWPFSTQVQGNGGYVRGMELGGKLAMSDITDADFLSNFGLDVNYTYSDSKQDDKGVTGEDLPFIGMSKNTYNLVLWYEQEEFSVRLAYNSRSPRLVTAGNAGTGGQALYQDDYAQLDFNATYNFNENISFYVNGANLTEEFQQTYLEFPDQKAFQNVYEARWTIGTRMTF